MSGGVTASDLQLCPADYFCELRKGDLFPDPTRPLDVDLGCGDGAFLRGMAAQQRGRDFLGIERLLGRVRKVCRKAQREGLTNLRVLRLDSAYALGYLLPTHGVARVHLLFPDPWPKKKHHKRRLVTREFCGSLERVLDTGGEFLFKTDHGEYFSEGCEAAVGSGLFDELPWEDGDVEYAETDFERLWKGQGRSIYRARFRVRD